MRHVVSGVDISSPQIMAIINVTPDSFYAATRTFDIEAVEQRVIEVLAQGATILDVGGYSSRPGAEQVPLEEEWRRVELGCSVVRRLTALPISIDTFRSDIAARVVDRFGEVIINDISAAELDSDMVDVVASNNLPYVAMHMRGTPQNMQTQVDYERGVVREVAQYLCKRVEWLEQRGVHRIILDPGFGFAKSLEQNYALLSGLEQITSWGYPVLAGLSRKSMIYKLLDISPEESLAATSVLNFEALRRGATILRVHDVREAQQVITLYNTLR